MGLHWTDWPAEVLTALRRGVVIPAHPLALNAGRQLDPLRQRALTRYYLDAGSGGVAVGVHSTQFAIRDVGLYEPVLELAMRTAREWQPMGRERRRAHRALPGGGRGDAARGLLSAAGRRRHRAAGVVLAALRRHRQRRR